MGFEIINQLSESKLYPSQRTLDGRPANVIAQQLYVYVIALRIIVAEQETNAWARTYTRRTVNTWREWHTNSNDLAVLMLSAEAHNFRFDCVLLSDWLESVVAGNEKEYLIRKILSRIDGDLKIHDTSLTAIRRLVMSWKTLEHHERCLVMTRLLQIIRARMNKAEIIIPLLKIARINDLELNDVTNKDDPDNEPSLLSKIAATAIGGFVGYKTARSLGKK